MRISNFTDSTAGASVPQVSPVRPMRSLSHDHALARVQRHHLHMPDAPVAVVCVDGSDPEYFRRSPRGRRHPQYRAVHEGGFLRDRALRNPKFCLSQQYVDRDGQPSQGARHFGQLLSRSEDCRGGRHDRAGAYALAHDFRRAVEDRRQDIGCDGRTSRANGSARTSTYRGWAAGSAVGDAARRSHKSNAPVSIILS